MAFRFIPKFCSLKPSILAASANRSSFLVARSHNTLVEQAKNWDKAHQVYYGPDRDLKNFPIQAQPATAPPTRLGFIPESWFDFYGTKTGVTGLYVLGTFGVASVLSKELWIVDEVFMEVLAFWGAVIFVTKKLGPMIQNWIDDSQNAFDDKLWVEPLKNLEENSKNLIVQAKEVISQQDGQSHLFEAKRENVDLQLESEYRRRLVEVQKSVQKRMDYHIEVENCKRRLAQQNLVEYVVDNVIKGITPQQEKDSITRCLQDLKDLAPR